MRVAAVVLLIALGGCLGSPDDAPRQPGPESPPPPATDPDPAPAPGRIWLLRDFGFDGCQGVEVRASVDPESAQALLPDNHTAATDERGATARWRIMECRSFATSTTTLNGTLYGDVALDAGGHWYRFAIFSQQDNLAAAWTVAGYDVVTGNATMQAEEVGVARTVSAQFAGYEARFLAAAPANEREHATLRTQTPVGQVVWNETVDAAGLHGAGTWSVPQEDPFAPLLADGRAVPLEWKWLASTISDARAYRE